MFQAATLASYTVRGASGSRAISLLLTDQSFAVNPATHHFPILLATFRTAPPANVIVLTTGGLRYRRRRSAGARWMRALSQQKNIVRSEKGDRLDAYLSKVSCGTAEFPERYQFNSAVQYLATADRPRSPGYFVTSFRRYSPRYCPVPFSVENERARPPPGGP